MCCQHLHTLVKDKFRSSFSKVLLLMAISLLMYILHRFDVVSMFVRMLEGHPNLHWPLLVRLWELLHIQV